MQQTLKEPAPDIPMVAALVRGLSARGHTDRGLSTLLPAVLEHPAGSNIEILAAISGRAWEVLSDKRLLDTYLLRLAQNDHGQTAFEQCISDLLSLPALAGGIRQALRSPQQAVAVREAFARMTEPTTPTG
jgi:hypothetical protein